MTRARWYTGFAVGLAGTCLIAVACSEFGAVDASAVAEAGDEHAGDTDGDGGIDTDADARDGDAAAPPRCASGCPGDAGPCGVRDNGGTTSFCIDATEVTEADYAAFTTQLLGAKIDAGPPCGAVTVRVPAATRGQASVPVTGVSFCDARAYCEWAGKRLCGNINGGPLVPADYVPSQSQWLHACTNGGVNDVRLSGSCNLDASAPLPSGKTCEGALPGLFGMVGNVWEWIDVPHDVESPMPYGGFVGGAYGSAPNYDCKSFFVAQGDLGFRAPDVGFRCCSR
jgi:sulfatase modifying factor 1